MVVLFYGSITLIFRVMYVSEMFRLTGRISGNEDRKPRE